MTENSCQDRALLSALLDGELSAEQAAAVHRHMTTCAACRQRYEALKQTDALIHGMAAHEPAADFDRTFWRKVAELEDRKAGRAWLLTLLTGWRPVLASGLAVGIAAAILFYSNYDKRPSPEEVAIALNMDLLQNYDVIDHLDMLEHWDAIKTLKEPS